MKNAWRNLVAFGFASTLAVGCVVSSGDDDDGSAGASGSGGSSAGTGGSSAGTGGTGGTAGTAGTAGTGGTAGTAGTGGSGGMPMLCDPANQTDVCAKCVETNCCPEWEACLADGEACSEGGLMGEGEIVCFQDCVVTALTNPDAGSPDPNDVKASCAQSCATDSVLISAATNALVACMNAGPGTDGGMDCALDCFGG